MPGQLKPTTEHGAAARRRPERKEEQPPAGGCQTRPDARGDGEPSTARREQAQQGKRGEATGRARQRLAAPSGPAGRQRKRYSKKKRLRCDTGTRQ